MLISRAKVRVKSLIEKRKMDSFPQKRGYLKKDKDNPTTMITFILLEENDNLTTVCPLSTFKLSTFNFF
jgi:hypothetical protein